MGHRSKKYRASRAVDSAGKPLITPLRAGPRAKPLTAASLREYQPPAGKPKGPVAAMLRKTKGARKWVKGLPTIHYAREGYAWVRGQYIAMPRATGITHKFSTSRGQRRAQLAAADHPAGYARGETPAKSQRAHSKQRARERWAERKQYEPLSVAQFEQARKRARLQRAVQRG